MPGWHPARRQGPHSYSHKALVLANNVYSFEKDPELKMRTQPRHDLDFQKRL